MNPQEPEKKTLADSLRSNFFTGVFVLAPIGIVLWIVIWFWNLLMGLSEVIPSSLNPKILFSIENPFAAKGIDALVTLFILGIIIFCIWFIGLVSGNYLGRQLLKIIQTTIARVPLLNTVYSTMEQLLKTFSTGKSKNFRRVVEIEYPRKGLHTLALVTSERKDGTLTVYVPTTPNPTSGFYLIVSVDEVKNVDMSVEAALKEIISLGLVSGTGK